MAERAGWASAGISGLALIVSVVSYINSYKADTRSAAASRPVLQISSIRLVSPSQVDKRLDFEIDLHNFGLSTAEDVELLYVYSIEPTNSFHAPKPDPNGLVGSI